LRYPDVPPSKYSQLSRHIVPSGNDPAQYPISVPSNGSPPAPIVSVIVTSKHTSQVLNP
jgi:hypothetical protein